MNGCDRAIACIAALLLLLCGACVTALPRPTQTTPTAVATAPAPTPTPQPTPTPTAQPTSAPQPTATSEVVIQGLLDVRGPTDGAAVRTDGVVVHGFADLDATVQINGQDAELDDAGRFSLMIELSPGVNGIQVEAATPDGDSEMTRLSVISLMLPPQPHFLLVTQPEKQSVSTHPTIPLVGRTTPGTTVSVNGVTVPVDVDGVFSTTVMLETGPNVIVVQGVSVDGTALNEDVPVIYRPSDTDN